MKFKLVPLLGPALAVAATLFFAEAASAAIPSGATASLPALRQAYTNAVASRNPSALEALFDMSEMPKDTRQDFAKHVSAELGRKISDVAVKDPEPTLKAEYEQAHVHFPVPVVEVLKVTFVAALNQSDGVEYFIGQHARRNYFVIAAANDK